MPDQPYTAEDLRVEAARQMKTAVEAPDFVGISEQMQWTPIPSRPDDHWDDLDETQFDTAQRAIDGLIIGAADLSKWAVNLGADGLQPISGNLNIRDQAGADRVRLHFAFAPDMDQATRKAVIDQVADVIRHYS
ncbi:hypothetical protein AB0F24_17700 [Streptomyces platensis]|uniref:hypothetical protein n=1 Tax=Streptomyces platensis TaxID=58346 RepID=UPI0033FDB8D9